jgi:hypothetical protein
MMLIGSASLFEMLESSGVAAAIRQSSWMYTAIEIIHLLGIVLVAGGAIMFDIGLLSNRHSFPGAERFVLLTWSRRGLFLAVPSGVLLFITNAVALAADPVLWSKLCLLFLAGVNAAIFHVRVTLPQRHDIRKRYGGHQAALHGMASILLWVSIIACGRLLAY